MTHTFFHHTLNSSSARIATPLKTADVFLDKNEQSTDVDASLKSIALDAVMQENWNRYPAANHADIEGLIAGYCGLHENNIVTGPGSASIISTLLNYFAINGKRIIINQPSYSLFEYHCNSYNISFEPWLLNDQLAFDFNTMPAPDHNSVVIITSPNNPVGNAIRQSELEYLLHKYPHTLFLLDAVYCEFGQQDFTGLVTAYHNLAVIRSFSKAFPIAGLRLGYICAHDTMARAFRKLMLPFAITAFTAAFAKQVLFSPAFLENSKCRVKQIISERERLYRFLKTYYRESNIRVYPSQGNFLLIRLNDCLHFEHVMEGLAEAGIRVLNNSNTVLLKNCFRVSIGTAEENDAFLECLVKHSADFLLSKN